MPKFRIGGAAPQPGSAVSDSGATITAMALRVRRATVADAEAMGRIHVDAWRSAYRGVMLDSYLDGLSPHDRASMWSRNLARPRPGHELLVIEEHSIVRGFASLGPEEGQPDETDVGEIFGINLDPGAWGRGLGRRLLSVSVDFLRVSGYHEAVLWVVPENARARGLYSSAGWAADGAERQDEILGAVVTDIRYRVSLS